jgi:histidinol dehydrogenase
MKVYTYPEEKELLVKKLERRKQLYDRSLIQTVADIFNQVAKSGDKAILDLTKKFDNTSLNALLLTEEYIQKCLTQIPDELVNAINHARKNIEEVNQYLLPEPIKTVEIREGTVIGEKTTPLDSVGLWVPARKGPLISTALMLVGAAKTAGVNRIVVGMAPNADGKADPATVAASIIAGATDIVVGNGVGIIAGFSMGTETIPEVDGIFGPGPGGIAAAMSVAFSYGKKTVLGIGPTDSAIICDETADPEILTYDMINEGEHGPDSSSILATTSMEVAKEVCRFLEDFIKEGPERGHILKTVFSEDGLGAVIHCKSLEDAMVVINDYAPEHMIIKCNKNNEERVLKGIRNAGEILVGDYAPFTAGNYAIGITAVLPTNGYAKSVSGITSKDMVKTSTIGKLDKKALHRLLPTIREIGKWEGLPSHVLAVEKRFE